MNPFYTVKDWTCEAPLIEAKEILRIHKYRDQSKVRKIIRLAAEDAVKRAFEISKPSAKFVCCQIKSFKNNKIVISSEIVFEAEAFDKYLGGSECLLAFIMTIGPELDSTVVGLVNDVFEPLDALFLETAGWLTIERATKHLARHLKSQFSEQGWNLSLRMGPGYDYPSRNGGARTSWDLWQQRELFKMFGDSSLPIYLSQYCAMSPKMSRSGVYGLSRILS